MPTSKSKAHSVAKLSKPGLMIYKAEFSYPVPVAKLFAGMTTSIAKWWKPDFLVNPKDAKKIMIEPRVGGRMIEVWKGPGEGTLWGIVTEYKKNVRLEISGSIAAAGVIHGKLGMDFQAMGSKKSKLVLRHAATGEVNRGVLESFQEGWEFLLGEELRKFLR